MTYSSDLEGAIKQKKVIKFVDSLTVKDLKRDYLATVKIIPTKEKGMFGGFFGKKQKENAPEDVNKVLIEITHNGKQVATGK